MTDARANANELRLLILAPTGRDATLSESISAAK